MLLLLLLLGHIRCHYMEINNQSQLYVCLCYYLPLKPDGGETMDELMFGIGDTVWITW